MIHRNTQTLHRVSVDYAVREPGGGMTSHHFHSYYELYFARSGKARFVIDDRFFDLGQGDLILIPPRVFHCTQYPVTRCCRYTCYFRAEDISQKAISCLPEGGEFFSGTRVMRVPKEQQGYFSDVLEQMLREEEREDRQTAAMQYFLLQGLLVLASRVCSFREALPSPVSLSDKHVLLAVRYINNNYMNPLSAAQIAEAADLSPNYLSKKFRETVGTGVHEYLILVRLQHAALELLTSEDSITHIALRCGFSDSNYFKDIFKKNFGVAPREYRKNRGL